MAKYLDENGLNTLWNQIKTYFATKSEISSIPKFEVAVVDSLPTTNISNTTVYLIANNSSKDSNLYTEYIYVNSKWEKLGEQNFDLTGYATESWVEGKGYLTEHQSLTEYAKKSELPTVPTNVSAFTNDAGYLTEHQSLTEYAKKSELPSVPTNVSAFTNDAGYLTEHQDISTKQDKLIPGYGIEIQDDNTIDAEVKYIHQDKEWKIQTWEGYTGPLYGYYIWIDYNGVIHYDNNSTHYYLDSDGITWEQQTWTGIDLVFGHCIWKDYNGIIHYDYSSNHYYLDSDGETWLKQTWKGYNPTYGNCIWKDYNGIIHCEYDSNHYYLDSDNKTWIAQTWTGYNPARGYLTWKDYDGIIHYDEDSNHYYLDSDNETWIAQTWTGIETFYGSNIWTDNNNVIHYDYNSNHYYLDSNNKWKQQTWSGLSTFNGNDIWKDNNGVIRYDSGSSHYYLQEEKDQYLTRHNDELQTKLTAGEGVTIKNGVISVDVLTPGYGIEIINNTIDSEVEYIHQDEEWKIQTWNELDSIDSIYIWTDNNNVIRYDYNSDHYYLDSDSVTWKQQTWTGYNPPLGDRVWKDYDGVIHYDNGSEHYYLDSDGVTWKPYTWAGIGSVYGSDMWKDNNGIIHYDYSSQYGYVHYYLDSDNKTWIAHTWNGFTSFRGSYIWKDYDGVIHYDNNSTHYYLDSDGITWKQQTWNGLDSFNSFCIWRDNNGIIHYDYSSNHYYLDSDGITWKQYTWSGFTAIVAYNIWKDYNGVIHYDSGSGHYYLEESKNLYFTRHNDELQTKLKAGDNITISNGIISAVGGDLSNYYNKTEVDNKISAIPKFSISVVSTLPTTDISSTTVYLVANTTTQTQNLYTEYIYVNSGWEKLGEQTLDLSGYATTTALSAKQDSLTTEQLSAVNSGITSTKVSTYDGYATSIGNKVDKVSGKGLSTNDYTTTEKNKLADIAEGANNYSHPTYTSKTSGLYKITVDGTGHVSGTAAVTASDLPSHSHTTTLTTDSGTPSVTLAHNTTYKLTAGDSSVIFKTPSDNTIDVFTATSDGLVPAPTAANLGKYLKSDGTWSEIDGIKTYENNPANCQKMNLARFNFSVAGSTDAIYAGAMFLVTVRDTTDNNSSGILTVRYGSWSADNSLTRVNYCNYAVLNSNKAQPSSIKFYIDATDVSTPKLYCEFTKSGFNRVYITPVHNVKNFVWTQTQVSAIPTTNVLEVAQTTIGNNIPIDLSIPSDPSDTHVLSTRAIDTIRKYGNYAHQFYGTNGAADYIHFCRLKTKVQWNDELCKFEISGRNTHGNIYFKLTGSGGVADANGYRPIVGPTAVYQSDNSEESYLYWNQPDQYTLDLYWKKSYSNEWYGITSIDIGPYARAGLEINWTDSQVTALPEGSTKANFRGLANYAKTTFTSYSNTSTYSKDETVSLPSAGLYILHGRGYQLSTYYKLPHASELPSVFCIKIDTAASHTNTVLKNDGTTLISKVGTTSSSTTAEETLVYANCGGEFIRIN